MKAPPPPINAPRLASSPPRCAKASGNRPDGAPLPGAVPPVVSRRRSVRRSKVASLATFSGSGQSGSLGHTSGYLRNAHAKKPKEEKRMHARGEWCSSVQEERVRCKASAGTAQAIWLRFARCFLILSQQHGINALRRFLLEHFAFTGALQVRFFTPRRSWRRGRARRTRARRARRGAARTPRRLQPADQSSTKHRSDAQRGEE